MRITRERGEGGGSKEGGEGRGNERERREEST
jgi:hypothetical protein